MKAVRPYARITVTPKGERALTGGHPWVYEGEVVSLEGTAEDGGLVLCLTGYLSGEEILAVARGVVLER